MDDNPDLMTIGVRSEYGTLRLDTGQHQALWKSTDAESATEKIKVPVMIRHRLWGNVEFCFREPHQTSFQRIFASSTVRFLAFYVVVGTFVYMLFVVRVMGVFNNMQVVPDRVRQALDTLAEGLLVLDGAGRIVLANQAFADIIAIDSKELIHRRASELDWVIDDVAESGYPWMKAIETSELQSESMLRIALANGTQRIFSVNVAPLGKDRTQRGALATFRDVTHVEEHRAELEQMLSLLRGSRDEIESKNRTLEILATQDSLTGCLNRRAILRKV